MKNNKRQKIIIGLLLLLMVGASLVYYFGVPWAGNGTKIYVEKVADIMNLGSGNGGQNRYAGVVESQDVWNISNNPDKTVKEIYVEEGDSVKVGDKLFAYDNEEAELNLAQAKLELERMENEIKAGEAEIASLEAEKKQVSSSDQIEYTIQIQSQKAANKKTEYEIKSQKAKIESLEKAAKNSVVKSEMAGVVQKINQSAISDGTDVEDYYDGDDSTFMSILATGDYRIKATVNEQNQWTIVEGSTVIVRSRVDDEVSWTGTISDMDTDNPESAASDTYSASSDDMTTSSQYTFYVDLDTCDGLILGQHVYVEPDSGQDEEVEGIWLDSYYIVQEEVGAQGVEESTEELLEIKNYVWVENSLGRLEKREITLGGYDEELDKYEVIEGLTEEDYIAFPEDDLKEGMKTTKDIEEAAAGEDVEGDEDLIGDESLDYDSEFDYDGEGTLEDGDLFQSFDSEDDSDVFQEFDDDSDVWEEDDLINEDGTVGSIDMEEVLL